MSDRDADALVVLADGPRTASFYLAGDTCLNQVARLAAFVDASIQIAITPGHTESKWKGRGQR